MSGSAKGPFQNGVRPAHAIVLVVFLLIRYSAGGVSKRDIPGHQGDHKLEPELHASAHGGNEHGGENDHHGYQVFHVEFTRVELPFIISLWIFVSSLAKIGFHMTPKLHLIFPESCLLIVVGIVIGFLLFWTSDHKPPSTLTPDVFFLFMLPPIILDAGYFMPNRLFFDHLGTILLMAVVGTIFNAMTIGAALYACGMTGIFGDDPPGVLETFLFSSLISAVDPVAVLAVFEEIHVNEILYIVVFGESLLNDAVTVVLYHMFEAYVEIGPDEIAVNDVLKGFASFLVVALGGTIVGIIWGFVTGFVTRFTHHARILEPLFVFTMAYLSYLNAEIFHLSGIMAITFCGITMKNYVERNISSKSQTTLKYAMKMLSGSSETIIFMFLGVATINDNHDWNTPFIVLTILFCTVFRVIGVLILATLANNYRLHKLSKVDQFVMMYGGLRGAVAFALVLLIDKKKVPHADMFITTTIAMVYWTVFVQGITIKPLVKFLNVKIQSEKDPTMNERIAGRFMDHVVAGMEGILGELGNLRLRDMYKRIDDKFIKPALLRENHFKDPKIIETYENLTERDAMEFMKRNPTQFAELAGSKSAMNLSGLDGGTTNPNLLSAQRSAGVIVPSGSSHALSNNLDLNELHYSQTQKDLTETKIHHMLTENLFMPRNRPRRLSYSRHAVADTDVSMGHDVNFKMHMQVRRMMSENRAMRKRKNVHSQLTNRLSALNDAESVPGERVTGASKRLQDDRVHEVIDARDKDNNNEEYITFSPPHVHEHPTHISGGLLPGYEENSGPIVALLQKGSYSNKAYAADSDDDTDGREHNEAIQAKVLPWRRNEESGVSGVQSVGVSDGMQMASWVANESDFSQPPPYFAHAHNRRRNSAHSEHSTGANESRRGSLLETVLESKKDENESNNGGKLSRRKTSTSIRMPDQDGCDDTKL